VSENTVYIKEKEAAEILGRSVSTLRVWRTHKQGPRFFKDGLGGIRYAKADLEAFIRGETGDDASPAT